MDHILKAHTRDETEKYVVKLRFHSSTSKLVESRQPAFHRIKCVDHSLVPNPRKNIDYRKFMK